MMANAGDESIQLTILNVWKHDPYLNKVFDLFVWGVDSMAKLIESSPDISRRFALRVQGLEDSEVYGPRIKHMDL